MKIKGFQPLTLSDFPGKVAAIIFTQGCNFRCPFCHNGDLLSVECDDKELFSEDHIIATLKKRSKQLDALVISGGEPTLQYDLIDFIHKIKNIGLQVKLDTNGTNPNMLNYLVKDNLIDYFAMDIKAPLDKYHILSGVISPVENIIKSISIIADSGIEHEFRTTFVPALMNADDLEKIKTILPQGSLYKIQAFNPENALDPALTVI